MKFVTKTRLLAEHRFRGNKPKEERGEEMEQNCAVWITVVFVFTVMGLAFLFPAKGKDASRSIEGNKP